MNKHKFEGITLFIYTAKKECELNQIDGLEKSVYDISGRLFYSLSKMRDGNKKIILSNNKEDMSMYIVYGLVSIIKEYFEGSKVVQLCKDDIMNLLDTCIGLMKEPYEYKPSSYLEDIFLKLIESSKDYKSYI